MTDAMSNDNARKNDYLALAVVGWVVAGAMTVAAVTSFGALAYLQHNTVSRADQDETLRISERLLTINEMCLRIRVRGQDPARVLGLLGAEDAATLSGAPAPGDKEYVADDHGKVRNGSAVGP